MTTTLEWPAPTSVKPRQRPGGLRRHWRLLVALVLVLALAGTTTGWLVYAHTYQPWQPGDEGFSGGHEVVGVTDGLRETALIVTAPVGQTGWYGMTLRLGGSHDVTFLGPPPDSLLDGAHLKWQASWGSLAPSPSGATTQPLAVHPGQLVTLWIFLTRPKCGQGEETDFTGLAFRWKALGVHHVSVVPITAGAAGPTPIYLCYPAKALQHLYPG